MKNLTSIAEHSKWLGTKFEDAETKWKLHCKRIVFGEQPLELWMFVPCKLANGVWVVLEEPKCYGKKYTEDIAEEELILHEEFVQAKEKVIFKNFKINYFDLGGSPIDKNSSFEILSNDDKFQICIYKSKPDYFIWNYKTIEDLVKYNLELTETAQKQIGL